MAGELRESESPDSHMWHGWNICGHTQIHICVHTQVGAGWFHTSIFTPYILSLPCSIYDAISGATIPACIINMYVHMCHPAWSIFAHWQQLFISIHIALYVPYLRAAATTLFRALQSRAAACCRQNSCAVCAPRTCSLCASASEVWRQPHGTGQACWSLWIRYCARVHDLSKSGMGWLHL